VGLGEQVGQEHGGHAPLAGGEFGQAMSTQEETLNDLQGLLVADVCRWPSWGSRQGGLYGGRT